MEPYLGHALAFVCCGVCLGLMLEQRRRFRSRVGWVLMFLGLLTEAGVAALGMGDLYRPLIDGFGHILFVIGLLFHLANLSTNGKDHHAA